MSHESKFLFSNKTPVRFDDLSYGISLCHTKLISIIHHSRALFLSMHNLSEINCFDTAIVILNLTVKYHSQCSLNDMLETSICLGEIKKATVIFTYKVINIYKNKLVAESTTEVGFYDRNSGKLRRTPKDFTTLLTNGVKNKTSTRIP